MDNQNKQVDDPQSQQPTLHPPGHVIIPGAPLQQPLDQPTQAVNQPVPTQPPPSSPITGFDEKQQPSPPTTNEIKKPSKVKLPLLLGLIVVVLVAVSGTIYALHAQKHKTITTTKVITGSGSSNGVSASVTAPVTTTVNCGSETCFATHFKNCSVATLTATSPIANVKYKIYGKKGNGCSMLFEYTSNPNPAWVNQPMTCNFDNSKSLDDSVQAVITDLSNKQNTYDCTGPLVAILQSQ